MSSRVDALVQGQHGVEWEEESGGLECDLEELTSQPPPALLFRPDRPHPLLFSTCQPPPPGIVARVAHLGSVCGGHDTGGGQLGCPHIRQRQSRPK
jgi:hypothetical protein